MDILVILGGLIAALVYAVVSCARSYFEKGRLQGMEEATREFTKGINSHYELEGQGVPERVAEALKGVRTVSRKTWKPVKGVTDPHHAQLWILGNAIGEACWLKGHAAGMRHARERAGRDALGGHDDHERAGATAQSRCAADGRQARQDG